MSATRRDREENVRDSLKVAWNIQYNKKTLLYVERAS